MKLFQSTVIVATILLLWTLFHSNRETDINLLIVQKKLAVKIRCTGFNMIVQNKQISKLETGLK